MWKITLKYIYTVFSIMGSVKYMVYVALFFLTIKKHWQRCPEINRINSHEINKKYVNWDIRKTSFFK